MNKTNERKATYPISDIFLNRWSPRAMSGEPMTDKELMPLFEAARWAPSSYNGQPWRFIYGSRILFLKVNSANIVNNSQVLPRCDNSDYAYLGNIGKHA